MDPPEIAPSGAIKSTIAPSGAIEYRIAPSGAIKLTKPEVNPRGLSLNPDTHISNTKGLPLNSGPEVNPEGLTLFPASWNTYTPEANPRGLTLNPGPEANPRGLSLNSGLSTVERGVKPEVMDSPETAVSPRGSPDSSIGSTKATADSGDANEERFEVDEMGNVTAASTDLSRRVRFHDDWAPSEDGTTLSELQQRRPRLAPTSPHASKDDEMKLGGSETRTTRRTHNRRKPSRGRSNWPKDIIPETTPPPSPSSDKPRARPQG